MDTATSLIEQLRKIAPALTWRMDHRDDRVNAHLEDRRMLAVAEDSKQPGTYTATVSRLVREWPTEPTPADPKSHDQTTRLYSSRTYAGANLAELVALVVADTLPPCDVLGLSLYHYNAFGLGERWVTANDDFTFATSYDGRWRWQWTAPAARALAELTSGTIGRVADTLELAVADALAAPRQLAALIALLVAQAPPTTPPQQWAYAAQLVGKDGERILVGPEADLLALRAACSTAEAPLIGHMDLAETYIVARRDIDAASTTAEALLTHPAARRLPRH